MLRARRAQRKEINFESVEFEIPAELLAGYQEDVAAEIEPEELEPEEVERRARDKSKGFDRSKAPDRGKVPERGKVPDRGKGKKSAPAGKAEKGKGKKPRHWAGGDDDFGDF
jgi:hypothetical protein